MFAASCGESDDAHNRTSVRHLQRRRERLAVAAYGRAECPTERNGHWCGLSQSQRGHGPELGELETVVAIVSPSGLLTAQGRELPSPVCSVRRCLMMALIPSAVRLERSHHQSRTLLLL
jgi:hypothetical protein